MRREYTTISGVTMRFHPLIADADQALALQPVIGHPGLGAEGSGQMLMYPHEIMRGFRRQTRPVSWL